MAETKPETWVEYVPVHSEMADDPAVDTDAYVRMRARYAVRDAGFEFTSDPEFDVYEVTADDFFTSPSDCGEFFAQLDHGIRIFRVKATGRACPLKS